MWFFTPYNFILVWYQMCTYLFIAWISYKKDFRDLQPSIIVGNNKAREPVTAVHIENMHQNRIYSSNKYKFVYAHESAIFSQSAHIEWAGDKGVSYICDAFIYLFYPVSSSFESTLDFHFILFDLLCRARVCVCVLHYFFFFFEMLSYWFTERIFR